MRTSTKKERIFLWIVFFLWLVLHLFLAFRHEAWRDEAQAYLVVRDCKTLSKLWEQLAVNGHPILWYLAMAIPVKLGMPLKYLSLVSTAVMACAAGTLLFRSPFPLWSRVFFLFSLLFSYSLPIIARDYCLIALILCRLAVWFPRRREGKKEAIRVAFLLFLLLQVHVVIAGTAIVLGFVTLWDTLLSREGRKKAFCYLPALGTVVGVVLLILELCAGSALFSLGGADMTVGEFLCAVVSDPIRLGRDLILGCTELVNWFHCIGSDAVARIGTMLLFSLVFGNFMLLPRYGEELLILVVGFGSQVFVHRYLWAVLPQRAICAVFVVFFYVWMLYQRALADKDPLLKRAAVFRSYALFVLLFLSLFSYEQVIKNTIDDGMGNYSGGEEIAAYLNDVVIPEGGVVVSGCSESWLTSIVGHLNGEEVILETGSMRYETSFVNWNDLFLGEQKLGAIYKIISQTYETGTPVYILLQKGYGEWDHEELKNLKNPINQYNGKEQWGEAYSLYRFDWSRLP